MTDILTVHVNGAFMAGLSPKGVEPAAHTIRNYGLVLKASCCFVQCLVNILTKDKNNGTSKETAKSITNC